MHVDLELCYLSKSQHTQTQLTEELRSVPTRHPCGFAHCQPSRDGLFRDLGGGGP